MTYYLTNMEWNYLSHGDDSRKNAGVCHSTQAYSGKYREGSFIVTDDDYSKDSSVYGIFRGEISKQRCKFGGNTDEGILLFENAQEAQNDIFTEYNKETNMIRNPQETKSTGAIQG